ncbi:hypothetical protein GCM10010358_14400 [Streptomyces minutiscleroticus]|uniref:Uncharacterized protein n=1 Tax=Streptomyces minutiscleroticus TaxID=68238 RepID=A0A918NDZ9_9ACTN|nr:hypothetical protein GCM10010358_14400 [Streptomyces minutiscleroticus]
MLENILGGPTFEEEKPRPHHVRAGEITDRGMSFRRGRETLPSLPGITALPPTVVATKARAGPPTAVGAAPHPQAGRRAGGQAGRMTVWPALT